MYTDSALNSASILAIALVFFSNPWHTNANLCGNPVDASDYVFPTNLNVTKATFMRFGYSIARTTAWMIVGADNYGGGPMGAVMSYKFNWTSNTYYLHQVIEGPINGTTTTSRFGASVSLYAPNAYPADGDMFAAGADAWGGQGRVFIYRYDITTDTWQLFCTMYTPMANSLGETVYIDQWRNVYTGSTTSPYNGLPQVGVVFAVYYDPTSGTYGATTQIVPPTIVANQSFSFWGSSIVVGGNAYPRWLFVGAKFFDSSEYVNNGAVVMFENVAVSPTTSAPVWTFKTLMDYTYGPIMNETLYGYTVDLYYGPNPFPEAVAVLAVGGFNWNNSNGAVWIYALNSTGDITLQKRLGDVDTEVGGVPDSYPSFGYSISIRGDTFVIGCPGWQESSSKPARGAVFVYSYDYVSQSIVCALQGGGLGGTEDHSVGFAVSILRNVTSGIYQGIAHSSGVYHVNTATSSEPYTGDVGRVYLIPDSGTLSTTQNIGDTNTNSTAKSPTTVSTNEVMSEPVVSSASEQRMIYTTIGRGIVSVVKSLYDIVCRLVSNASEVVLSSSKPTYDVQKLILQCFTHLGYGEKSVSTNKPANQRTTTTVQLCIT